MFVKPTRFARVLDPETRIPVPEHGRDVPETTYWLRRLRCGDLVRAEPLDTTSTIDDTRPLHQTPDDKDVT